MLPRALNDAGSLSWSPTTWETVPPFEPSRAEPTLLSSLSFCCGGRRGSVSDVVVDEREVSCLLGEGEMRWDEMR